MPGKEPVKTRILPAEKQPRTMLYEMSIRFKADAGLKTLDGMLDACFPGERISVKDGLVLRMTQTVPFIPDPHTLEKYAKILEDAYSKNPEARVSNVRFDGYDFLYAVAPAEKASRRAHGKDGICAAGAPSSGTCAMPCSRCEPCQDQTRKED